MLKRFAALCLLLMAAACLGQTSSKVPPLSIFRDSSLGLSFGYPSEFVPWNPDAAKNRNQSGCVRTVFSAGAENKLGSSAFVLSVIDGTCPGVLKQAEQPGPFTRQQLQRQLTAYGAPTLYKGGAFHYDINGRPAAVSLGWAQSGKDGSKVTYAAKACFHRNPSYSADKTKPAANAVICLDYTTQNRDLMMRLVAFTVKFTDENTFPAIPGNALP
ncbi:MAG: hypothetical protein FWD64_02150 [Acidobacteriaceae bacterium]|nr:hypothetical protein [Acidobacteriaceae bacterium]